MTDVKITPRLRLDALRGDPRVKAFVAMGLGGLVVDLAADLVAALEALEARAAYRAERCAELEQSSRALAEVILRRHFGDPSMTTAQLRAVAKAAGDQVLLGTLEREHG